MADRRDDARGKKIVFVSSCLLNTNNKVKGLARYSGMCREVFDTQGKSRRIAPAALLGHNDTPMTKAGKGGGGNQSSGSFFLVLFTCDKGFAFAATRSASLSMCV